MNETRLLLLGLLHDKELYGYQIAQLLQAEELREWAPLAVSDLYEELERLLEEGLIRRTAPRGAEDRPARHIYRITAEGRNELARLVRDAWVEGGRWGRLQDLATLFADAVPKEALAQALQERVKGLQEHLKRIEERLRQSNVSGLRATASLIYEHLRGQLEAEISWTRSLIVRVEAGELLPARQAVSPPARMPRRPRTQAGIGAFTFVLHSHLPYCRMAGQWPHGEEWLHEAAAETYVPLLNALYDLRDEGVDYSLTIGLTPVLVEQLADADVRAHFAIYLEEEIAAAESDIPRFGEAGNAHQEYLATFYRDYYRHIRDSFFNRFSGDIVGAFRTLQDGGYIEIVTSAATHGYLPLLSRDSSIYGQLRTGVESYRRHFGRSPRAVWLPECAYRPAYVDEDGTVRPAIEEFLSALGLTCFFAETHAVEGGRPVGVAAGEVSIGPYAAIVRRYVIPSSKEEGPRGTTFAAYYVVGNAGGLTDPPVAVLGRNNRTGQQVWSADLGYPGDADYREFHKKDHQTGLQYWRVTGPKVDLGDKDLYHPDWAMHKVGEHARHYIWLVERLLEAHHAEQSHYGIVASNYDTELFGHWWFEGIEWIKQVLQGLAQSDIVDLTTASEYIAHHPPTEVIALPESSWGVGGTHWTWDNPETHWIWEPIQRAERRMEALVARFPEADDALRPALNQAARELLLLQASDWPFLITTGQAKQYAIERFDGHLQRFQRLADLLESGQTVEAAQLAQELYERDKVFPDIDYRWFEERQGRAK